MALSSHLCFRHRYESALRFDYQTFRCLGIGHFSSSRPSSRDRRNSWRRHYRRRTSPRCHRSWSQSSSRSRGPGSEPRSGLHLHYSAWFWRPGGQSLERSRRACRGSRIEPAAVDSNQSCSGYWLSRWIAALPWPQGAHGGTCKDKACARIYCSKPWCIWAYNLQISIHCQRRDWWRHFREPHVRPWLAWRRRWFWPPQPPMEPPLDVQQLLVASALRSLGPPDYRSGASRGLGREVMETLQSAEETLPKNIEAIELKDLSGVADTTSKRRRRRNHIEDH